MSIEGVAWPSGVFVGRSAELGELRAALTEALGGSSRAVLVSGEPGIGKTALVARLAGEAEALGVPVSWGRGSEREGAPAFWPWIQIVRDQLLRSDPADRKRLERHAAPLYRLMPQLKRPDQHLRTAPAPTGGSSDDSGEARFRLFDATSSFLRAAAGERGLVIALDDAHWADAPTLLLLRHLVRELGRDPALFVVSFREEEMAADGPVAAALAELAGGPEARWIRLQGLDRTELAQHLAPSSSSRRVQPWPLGSTTPPEETRSSPPSWHGCSRRRDVWRVTWRLPPTSRSVCPEASARCCSGVLTA